MNFGSGEPVQSMVTMVEQVGVVYFKIAKGLDFKCPYREKEISVMWLNDGGIS